jgi:cytochrome c oxidase cbb3-type subunit 3
MNTFFKKIKFSKWLIGLITCLQMGAFAAGPPQPSALSFPIAQILVVIIIFLLLAIVLLANVLIETARFKITEDQEKKKSNNTSNITLLLVGIFSLLSIQAFAADNPETTDEKVTNYGGLTAMGYNTLVSLVLLELLILLVSH